MENKSLWIAIASVLIFTISLKAYDILASLLILLRFKLDVENEAVLFVKNCVLGLLSVVVLVALANKLVVNKSPKPQTIYLLAGITIIVGVLNFSQGNFLNDFALAGYRSTYSLLYGNSKSIKVLLPLISLFYFIFKLHRNHKATFENG